MGKPKGQDTALESQKWQLDQAKQQAAIQQQAYEQVKPYYSALLALGVDPANFGNTALGQSLISGQIQPIDKESQAAMQNIIEGGGATGQYGSGALAGPLANTQSQAALARSNVFQQMPQMALNLAGQGAAGLTGQQQIANPLGWAGATSSATNAIPHGGFWESFTTNLGSSLGKSLGGWAGPGGVAGGAGSGAMFPV